MPRQRPDDARWLAAIDDFRRSGLTQPEFCRRRGLPLHTFRRYLYGRRGAAPSPAAAAPPPAAPCPPAQPRFLLVTLAAAPTAPAPAAALALILDARHRIAVAPGFDPETLRRLVDALEARP